MYGRILRWLASGIGTIVIASAGAPANAHHGGSATSRLGFRDSMGSHLMLGSGIRPPRIDMSLAYDMSLFGRVLEAGSSYDRASFGRVLVHTLITTAAMRLASGTGITAQLPVGIVAVDAAGGESTTEPGLGDLQLLVSQDILTSWRKTRDLPVSVVVRSGLIFPTGRYAPDDTLSVTDVRDGTNGGVDITVFNSRASLGAGALSFAAAVAAGWLVHRRFWLQGMVTAQHPLTSTSDDIRWGTDVVASVQGRFDMWVNRLGFTIGADFSWHDHDRLPVVDEETGGVSSVDAGGRREMAVTGGVRVHLHRQVACFLNARVPVWQHVGGVQLVETVSGSVGCALSIGRDDG